MNRVVVTLMPRPVSCSHSRRGFVSALGLGLSSSAFAVVPKVTLPRATSGDFAVEPDWAERLTISVGNKNADLVGKNEKVIQAAVDWVAARCSPQFMLGLPLQLPYGSPAVEVQCAYCGLAAPVP